MNDITLNKLEQLISEALERTAFVMVDLEEDDLSDMLSRHAGISYTGPADGRLILSASDGFLAELASSLMGVDVDEVEPDKEGIDALTELANILGGSLLNELGGQTLPFKLGLPERLDDAGAADGNAMICRLESDGEPFHVTWMRAA